MPPRLPYDEPDGKTTDPVSVAVVVFAAFVIIAIIVLTTCRLLGMDPP